MVSLDHFIDMTESQGKKLQLSVKGEHRNFEVCG